jgi:hypothetical protein
LLRAVTLVCRGHLVGHMAFGAPLDERGTGSRRRTSDACFDALLDHLYERGRPSFDDLVLDAEERLLAVMPKPLTPKLVPVIGGSPPREEVRTLDGHGEAHANPRRRWLCRTSSRLPGRQPAPHVGRRHPRITADQLLHVRGFAIPPRVRR